MALFTRDKLKGMYQGSGRMRQPAGYFRRVSNMWQDRSGKYKCLGNFDQVTADVTTGSRRILARRYFDKLFTLYESFGNLVTQVVDKDGIEQQVQSEIANSPVGDTERHPDFGASTVIFNKLLTPVSSQGNAAGKVNKFNLCRYDGVQFIRAGLPLPYISCAQYSSVGGTFVRVVYNRVGFDGEMVSSGYLQFPSTPAANIINIRVDAGAVDIMSNFVGISPPRRNPNDLLNDEYDVKYVARTGTVTYDGGSETYVMESTDKDVAIGDWIMFKDQGISDNAFEAFPWSMCAMQVVDFDPLEVTFDANGKVYLDSNNTWEDDLILDLATTGVSVQYGSSIWIGVYTSGSATGNYTLRAQRPVLWNSAGATIWPVDVTVSIVRNFFAGQVSTNLGGWYDVTSVKTTYPPIKGVTKYQENLVAYDDNALYFSDNTLGGSTEMLSGATNIAPLGSEYGIIKLIEACEDFILICRERKNYVLVGDLATGNVRIFECDSEVLGGFCSHAGLGIMNNVVFVNKQGIFSVTSSGKIVEMSKDVSRLFSISEEPSQYDDSVLPQFQRMPGVTGNILRLRFDADRKLIAFMYNPDAETASGGGSTPTSVLVYGLGQGSWYEWGEFPGDQTEIEFFENYEDSTGKFEGSLYLFGDGVWKEDLTTLNAAQVPMLSTIYETLDTPSLEKQILQFKMYGIIPNVRILHQLDWKGFDSTYVPTEPETDTRYIEPVAGSYYHKKRLDSSKAMGASVTIIADTELIEFEGYEIEINPIQVGMKK